MKITVFSMLCFLREFVVVVPHQKNECNFCGFFPTEDEQNKFSGEAYDCAHVEE